MGSFDSSKELFKKLFANIENLPVYQALEEKWTHLENSDKRAIVLGSIGILLSVELIFSLYIWVSAQILRSHLQQKTELTTALVTNTQANTSPSMENLLGSDLKERVKLIAEKANIAEKNIFILNQDADVQKIELRSINLKQFVQFAIDFQKVSSFEVKYIQLKNTLSQVGLLTITLNVNHTFPKS